MGRGEVDESLYRHLLFNPEHFMLISEWVIEFVKGSQCS